MSSLNKAMLIGNVGRDPEQRQAGESTVCQFSVATSEKYKEQEHTEWHNVVCWNRLAGVVMQYVKKGSKVYVEGKIVTRSWEKDGLMRYRTEIVAYTVQFLDRKGDRPDTAGDPGPSPESAPPQQQQQQGEGKNTPDEDLPF